MKELTTKEQYEYFKETFIKFNTSFPNGRSFIKSPVKIYLSIFPSCFNLSIKANTS